MLMSGHEKNNGMTNRERRELARQRAREMRERERRRQRRNKILTLSSITVAVVGIIALVAWNIWSQREVVGLGPAAMASDGILFTGSDSGITVVKTPAVPTNAPVVTDQATARADGAAAVVVYADYICPYCGQFEKTNNDQLQSLLAQRAITLEFHPVALLDASSMGTAYSSRAANAIACVADQDPDRLLAVNAALFADQPNEGTAGLDDNALRSLVTKAGVTNDKVLTCIANGQFRPWVAAVKKRVSTQPLPNSSIEKMISTPTVLVNGKQYTGSPTDASAFANFIAAARSEGKSTATPTPAG
ncbi:hypothetical protein C5C66_07985 [Rathayibacter toxicus]|nr:hypothetical protein APU90_08945 [Rathayibacter toxicus]PPG20450.1 hypothetical protein C5D15_07980 [Rathayibacter toxicus]PPG45552.1 hypothetical protein C5D16_07950 [Rathayibacter toxicus]PPH62999.1 hypothetical protein C5D13_08040 [Rathayibacter toxicus]PPH66748.1 hypothetical protein C5D01_08030 [Rathayibacter toxicus]